MIKVLGIKIIDRIKEAGLTQEILSRHAPIITTRLGVNEVFFGEPAGLIILELKGDEKQRILLEKDLKALKQVHVRTMVF